MITQTETLLAELASIQERRARLVGAHVPHARSMATTIGGGIAQRKLDDLSARSLEAFDLDDVESEMRRLRHHLLSLEN